jgi:hypothetical protein
MIDKIRNWLFSPVEKRLDVLKESVDSITELAFSEADRLSKELTNQMTANRFQEEVLESFRGQIKELRASRHPNIEIDARNSELTVMVTRLQARVDELANWEKVSAMYKTLLDQREMPEDLLRAAEDMLDPLANLTGTCQKKMERCRCETCREERLRMAIAVFREDPEDV